MQARNILTSRNIKIALLTAYTAGALALMSLQTHAAGVPGDVTGLKATAIDSVSIGLSWNAAQQADSPIDHYRIYYGTKSIQAIGSGEYDAAVNTSNNATSYVVGGLKAGTPYYFAITAATATGEESELYSQEATATTLALNTAVVPPETTTPDTTTTTTTTTPDTTTTTTPVITSPTVVSVEAKSKTKVKVVFSVPVKLPAVAPEVAFMINEQINTINELPVKTAGIDKDDTTGKTVIVTTSKDQTKDMNYVLTAGVTVTDMAGNPIKSGNQDSGLFAGTDKEEEATVVKDTTPPEGVTNLLLSFKQQVNRFLVLMDWTASIDSAKDLADQMIYMSLNGGKTYDKGKSLGAKVVHNEVANLKGGQEYTFKITTKDNAGNESVGVVKSIRLPQTGVGVGIFLMGSAAIAQRILRKKKK